MADDPTPVAPGDPGGPGVAPTPAAPTPSAVKEIEINGQKFSVDSALADAFIKDQEKIKIQLDDNAKFISDLKKTAPPTPPDGVTPGAPVKPTEPTKPTSDVDLLFTDTEQFLNNFQKKIEDKLVGRYEADKAREKNQGDFWDKFWTINDDLNQDDKDIVELVMTKEFEELQALPVGDQYKALGDKTRERLLKLGVKKDSGQPSKKVVVEGASIPTPEGGQGDGDDATPSPGNVTSIGDIMKRKAEERQNALYQRKA